jgi:hypothetical protein
MNTRPSSLAISVALVAGAIISMSLVAHAQDNGDAPAPYPTCSHTTTSSASERLGATRTADFFANPVTPAWTGDVDDGVTFSTLTRGESAALTVDIQSFFVLDALAIWIDWNEDGDWNDGGERVVLAGFNGTSGNYGGGALVGGSNVFVVNVPTNAGPVSSKAPCRIRLWDNSDPGSISTANPLPSVNTVWGEVEDYLVTVNNAPAFQITSVTREGSDIRITWMTGPGKTNALQRTTGDANGSYVTNNFADIFTVTNTTGIVTNYLDFGAATNFPSLYYRIRLVP